MSLNPRNGEAPNILFVSHDAHPNGAQYALLTLTTWLKETGMINPRFIMAGQGVFSKNSYELAQSYAWIAGTTKVGLIRFWRCDSYGLLRE